MERKRERAGCRWNRLNYKKITIYLPPAAGEEFLYKTSEAGLSMSSVFKAAARDFNDGRVSKKDGVMTLTVTIDPRNPAFDHRLAWQVERDEKKMEGKTNEPDA